MATYRAELERRIAALRKANRWLPWMVVIYGIRVITQSGRGLTPREHPVASSHADSDWIVPFYLVGIVVVVVTVIVQRRAIHRTRRELRELHS